MIDRTVDRISREGLENSSSNLIPPDNLIVVTRMGLGKVSINTVPMAINQDLRAIFLSKLASINFYYIFFKTASFAGQGLTVKGIKTDELLNMPFPLPPLAEQHRIVAKVDELIALCDELEAAQTKREERRDRLVASTLHGMNNGENGDDFRENARFYFNHLPRLTTRPEHIQQLRQTILNLAVRGKLVSLQQSDDNASDLLQRIRWAREHYFRASKGNRNVTQSGIQEQEKPFVIPAHWEWIRLIQIGILSGGMTPSTNRPDFWEDEFNWFSPKDMKSNELTKSELRISENAITETRLQLYPPGCLFMVARSGILKRKFPVSINRIAGTVNQDLKVLQPFVNGMERYLQIALTGMSGFILTELVKTGTTVQSLKYSEFELLPIPIPPVAEQQRIVGKVDELMAICDELENRLAESTTTRVKLLVATLQEALSA